MSTDETVHAALKAGFFWDELEWKVQATGKSQQGLWARVVPYIDTRAIIARLDAAVGPAGYDINLEPILTGAVDGGRRSGFKAGIVVMLVVYFVVFVALVLAAIFAQQRGGGRRSGGWGGSRRGHGESGNHQRNGSGYGQSHRLTVP